MNLDGVIFGKLINSLQQFLPARVVKVVQKHQFQLVLKLRHHQREVYVVINFQPQNYYFFATEQTIEMNGGITTPLVTLLRKHLQRGFWNTAEQYHGDRLGVFTFSHQDHLGTVHSYRLVLEFFGRFINVVLLDGGDQILGSVHTTSLESNRPIMRGLPYPWPQEHKPSLLTWQEGEELRGFGKLMVAEMHHRSLDSIREDYHRSHQFYLYPQGVYHVVPLKHLGDVTVQEVAYDHFYLHTPTTTPTTKTPLRQRLEQHLHQEITKLEHKLEKLHQQVLGAERYPQIIERAQALLTYHYDRSFPLEGDFTAEELADPFGTSQKLFRQAGKYRRSLPHLAEQITQGGEKRDRYQEYYHQLSFNSEAELPEIASVVGIKVPQAKKGKGQQRERCMVWRRGDLVFYIGKNAVQNEYLWRQVARKHYLWFHVAHYSGAHVLVNQTQLAEEEMRLAAKLAGYFSQARWSSSIEVNYTLVKHLRKGSGLAVGKVTMQEHRSIFIDVEEAEIRELFQGE